MHPVTFVRTAPTVPGDASPDDTAVCVSCGSSVSEGVGRHLHGGYAAQLSLDELFVRHPSATYFFQVGLSDDVVIRDNTYLGVRTGDVLTVDRTLSPRVGSLVLAVCEGELALCRYTEHEGRRFLVCGERDKTPVEIVPEGGVDVWGVVAALGRRM